MKIFLLIMVLILLAGTISIVQAVQPVQEAALNQAGSSWEINPDAEGGLWITDFDAGEVWWVNPAPEVMAYTQYLIQYPMGQGEVVSGNPSDARRDGDYFWWADALTNYIGRAVVENGDYLLWQVQGAETFYGSAVDYLGRFWVAEWPKGYPIPAGEEPNLIQVTVNPAGTAAAICTFTLPDEAIVGGTRYMAYRHPYLWLGDERNGRIIRLDVTSYHFDSWALPDYRTTFGMAVDDEGDYWFADWDALVEFDPDLESITVFEIPIIGDPQMIAVEGERIWYSDFNKLIGVLNSTTAVLFSTVDLSQTRVEGTLVPSCDPNVTPHPSDSLTMLTGSLPWAEVSYDQLVNEDGWLVLKMLEDSDPLGIAYLNEMIYVVDQGRQKLVKFPASIADTYKVFLALILR